MYALHIVSRSALKTALRAQAFGSFPFNANIEALSPTWSAVRDFFQWVFHPLGFNLTDAALAVLTSNSFAQLTGCPAQCTYAPSSFPSAAFPAPVIVQNRTGANECPDPSTLPGPAVTLTAPTFFITDSELCTGLKGRTWTDKQSAMAAFFPNGTCSPRQVLQAGVLMTQQVAATKDAIEQALWFRAFLLQ